MWPPAWPGNGYGPVWTHPVGRGPPDAPDGTVPPAVRRADVGIGPYGAAEIRFVGRDDPARPSRGGQPQGLPLRMRFRFHL